MTTQQYLRFTPSSVFGVIASTSGNIQQLEEKENKDSLFAVPACENIYIWNLHSKEKTKVFAGEKSSVSCMCVDSACKRISSGYIDGSIRIFDLKSSDCIVSFIGHKSPVSCLAFEDEGSNLASGGRDSEIVVWNVTEQTGLFRLKGHKGSITQCRFYKPNNMLISSSRDTFMKFWDIDTQHCFFTLVGSRHEILDFVIIQQTKLIIGANSPHLKVWSLNINKEKSDGSTVSKKLRIDPTLSLDHPFIDNLEVENDESIMSPTEIGELVTLSDRSLALIVDSSERLLGIHASTKNLQLFKILTEAEHNKKIRKRRNKELKRKKSDEDVVIETGIADDFLSLEPIHFAAKIDSFTLFVDQNDIAKVTAILKNNSIVQYKLDLKMKGHGAELFRSVVLPGHSSAIRSLSYSSDLRSVLSACDETVKIWRRHEEEHKCAFTLQCPSALCSLFVTGNNHCIIGTKVGKLNIFDINAQELLESVDAHEGPVNCICLSPNLNGIASGGRDKEVKFWDFELVKSDNDSKKRLSLTHTRTLRMPEEVICIKYSPDNKRVAVSLLDNTVQVLFNDSLKLVFSLYGHALPVTCMDISYDSTLIVTGSEDKDIRIWSMEFGSCNKFLKRAHNKGVTCLCFLPKSHLFFSAGRDNVLKEWDADNFQKVITLNGHQHEVTAMTVSSDGVYVVTASKDKSIRVWEKTAEPLVLQEEQENEREEENTIEDLPAIPGEANKEVTLSGMKTIETIKAVDQLIDALKLYTQELEKFEEYELECKVTGKKLDPPSLHPLLQAYRAASPLDYMRKVFKKIKSSELEGTLLYLPFNYVLDVLKIISEFVDKGWETELSEKCVTFLVRIHFGQILSAQHFQPVIENLKEKLFSQLVHMKDSFGFAKFVSTLQQKAIDAREDVTMFSDILDKVQKKKKRSKKKLERSLISFV